MTATVIFTAAVTTGKRPVDSPYKKAIVVTLDPIDAHGIWGSGHTVEVGG